MLGVVRSSKVGSSLLGWVSLVFWSHVVRVYLQCKLLSSTSESTRTIVVVGSVTIDLLANMKRKFEEAKSWTLHGADSLLLHLFRPFEGDGDLLDVVELLDRAEQVLRPSLDATGLVLDIEAVLEVG